jgi:hypothetical protein
MLILFLVFCFSCEKPILIKCADCLQEEPKNANLVIKLDTENPTVTTIVKIYEGFLEDSVLYRSYETSGEETTTSVTLNKLYTVTATYYIPYHFYVAVDAATPRVGYNKSQCDNPCYYIYDNTVNLRIKYLK